MPSVNEGLEIQASYGGLDDSKNSGSIEKDLNVLVIKIAFTSSRRSASEEESNVQ